MRVSSFLLLASLALLGCVAVSAAHEMHAAMPAEPESVARAIVELEHMDGLAHDDDATFFLELSQYVDDAALLESEAEHAIDSEADADADADADAEAEAGEEQTAVTKCGKKITWERNQEPNPEVALSEVESESETETEAESESEDDSALVESDSVTEVYSDSAADAEVEASHESDVLAAQALEATLATEADPNADHNPNALFVPKLRAASTPAVANHQTAVSQMKTLFQQAERDYPRNVAALQEESPYLTHVF